jgi:hypothetical protein
LKLQQERCKRDGNGDGDEDGAVENDGDNVLVSNCPTFRATKNHRNLTSGWDMKEELAKGTILAATRITGGQGIITIIINRAFSSP